MGPNHLQACRSAQCNVPTRPAAFGHTGFFYSKLSLSQHLACCCSWGLVRYQVNPPALAAPFFKVQKLDPCASRCTPFQGAQPLWTGGPVHNGPPDHQMRSGSLDQIRSSVREVGPVLGQ